MPHEVEPTSKQAARIMPPNSARTSSACVTHLTLPSLPACTETGTFSTTSSPLRLLCTTASTPPTVDATAISTSTACDDPASKQIGAHWSTPLLAT
jgi:hypothetical protein